MATNILACRLAHLERQGILVKRHSEKDKRKEEYVLTKMGLDLSAVLVEMANWSAEHDPHTTAPAAWIALMKTERSKMIRRIRETVQYGGRSKSVKPSRMPSWNNSASRSSVRRNTVTPNTANRTGTAKNNARSYVP